MPSQRHLGLSRQVGSTLLFNTDLVCKIFSINHWPCSSAAQPERWRRSTIAVRKSQPFLPRSSPFPFRLFHGTRSGNASVRLQQRTDCLQVLLPKSRAIFLF